MILKRVILFALVIVLTASCYNLKGPKKPKDLISKNKMVNILIDTRLLASATGANKVTLEENGVNFKTYIYEKYNIDSIQFAKSNEYYAYNVGDYDDIYTKVKDSMEALKRYYAEIEEAEQLEEIRQDSIKAALDIKMKTIKKDMGKIKKFPQIDSIPKKITSKKNKEGLIQPISDTELPKR